LSGNELAAGVAISLGALVSLETPEETAHYFIGPFAGGTEIVHEGSEIVVITPASALGQKLLGRRVGDAVALRPGALAEIIAVV
jgi:transcription elongation GreA/GreB family factor